MSESRIIVKLTTPSPALNELYRTIANYLNVLHRTAGINQYMELVEGGFLQVFESPAEFERYEVFRLSEFIGDPTAAFQDLPRQEDPLIIEAEVVQTPSGYPPDKLFDAMVGLYSILSENYEVEEVGNNKRLYRFHRPRDMARVVATLKEQFLAEAPAS